MDELVYGNRLSTTPFHGSQTKRDYSLLIFLVKDARAS